MSRASRAISSVSMLIMLAGIVPQLTATPSGAAPTAAADGDAVVGAWEPVLDTPGSRTGHAMAFDEARGVLVVFGGNDGLADTWEWDGQSWALRRTPVSPPPRTGAAMVYDAARQRVLLFGGCCTSTGEARGDTWEWDGQVWRQMEPASDPPPARWGHVMVYDPVREVVVLHGGLPAVDVPEVLADTWEWDGAAGDWRQVAAVGAPPALARGAAAFDPSTGMVVLVGGQRAYWNAQVTDTWGFDGRVWTPLPPLPVPERTGYAMGTDPVTGRVLLFGGEGHSNPGEFWVTGYEPWRPTEQADLWEYRGPVEGWHQVDVALGTEPPARTGHAMTFNTVTGRPMVFGGCRTEGPTTVCEEEVWELEGNVWLRSASQPGVLEGAATASAPGGGVLLFGGSGRAETWRWNGHGWSVFFQLDGPPGRSRHAMAYDVKRDVIVLFGGQAPDGTLLADTWEFDGARWIMREPPSSPVARAGHAMAYDVERHVVVLFAGATDDGALMGDVWEWDGIAWTQSNGATPRARTGHSMAYDEARGVMVVHGGQGVQGLLADTWELVDGQWVEAQSPLLPSASTVGGGMAFDPHRQRIVLTRPEVTWEWDGHGWSDASGPQAAPDGARRLLTLDRASARPVLQVDHTLVRDGTTWLPQQLRLPPASGTWESQGPFDTLATDTTRGRVVFHASEQGTWEWDGATFLRRRTALAPQWSSSGVHTSWLGVQRRLVFDPVRDVTVLVNGWVPDEVWEWDGDRWSPVILPAGRPEPDDRVGFTLTFDPNLGTVIMHGGKSMAYEGGLLDDMWSWDGTGWTEVAQVGRPPARTGHAVVLDPVRQELILFGGHQGPNLTGMRNDMWSWDGTRWERLRPRTFPTSRTHHAMATDPVRGTVVLHGGADGWGDFEDTWEWDGVDWTRMAESTGPSRRHGHALAHDPVGGGMVVLGGSSGGGDMWRYDHTPPTAQ